MTLFLAVLLALGQTTTNPKQMQPERNSDIENIGTRNINKGNLNFMALEKEIEAGRALAAEIEKGVKLVADPAVNEYINKLGQRIASNSDSRVPISFKVIDAKEANAFAIPGGFIYVNSGLILAARNEAELASVLAHEVAHIAARHGSEIESKAELLNETPNPLVFLGGPMGFAYTEDPRPFLVPMNFLPFFRQAVAEADYLGVQYLYKAGYDPAGAVDFLRKALSLEPGGSIATTRDSHPALVDRVAMTSKVVGNMPAAGRNLTVSTPEFAEIQAILK